MDGATRSRAASSRTSATRGVGCIGPRGSSRTSATRAGGVHAPRRGAAFSDDAVAFSTTAEWLRALSDRLRAVRVASGDWRRVVASPTTLFPAGRGDAAYRCGVFLDPPYLDGRMDYAAGGAGTDLSAQVRAWCVEHGDDKRLRAVLSGYAGEHDALESRGWRAIKWKANGGYGNASGNENARRERLWLSRTASATRPFPSSAEARDDRRTRPLRRTSRRRSTA